MNRKESKQQPEKAADLRKERIAELRARVKVLTDVMSYDYIANIDSSILTMYTLVDNLKAEEEILQYKFGHPAYSEHRKKLHGELGILAEQISVLREIIGRRGDLAAVVMEDIKRELAELEKQK